MRHPSYRNVALNRSVPSPLLFVGFLFQIYVSFVQRHNQAFHLAILIPSTPTSWLQALPLTLWPFNLSFNTTSYFRIKMNARQALQNLPLQHTKLSIRFVQALRNFFRAFPRGLCTLHDELLSSTYLCNRCRHSDC